MLSKKVYYFLVLITFLIICNSCSTYRFRYLKTDEEIITKADSLAKEEDIHYKIQKRDHIELKLFTNEGEAIIAPSGTVDKDLKEGNNPNQFSNNNNNNGNQNALQVLSEQRFPLEYSSFIVQNDGTLRLPKIGFVNVEGLTLSQVDSLLEIKYSKFYEGSFVRSRFLNKRITFFDGHEGQLLPLQTEKMSLTEILALTGGLKRDRRYDNIRLIRGGLQNPTEVKVIDYRTIASAGIHNLIIKPNDIIYIQPTRKIFLETLKDLSPIFSVITTTLTLILLLRK